MSDTTNQKASGIPFVLVNAFTRSTFGGNPAAILLQSAPFQDTETYLRIARNLNQPMCCFLSPAERTRLTANEEINGLKAAVWRIRWFSSEFEVPLCGHGTLAAAHALFSNLLRDGVKLVKEDVKLLRLETMHGHVDARRLPPLEEDIHGEGERYEIAMPCFDPVEANPVEFERARLVVCKAFGKPEVKVNYVGVPRDDAGKGADNYILIEVHVNEELGKVVVDPSAFLRTAPRHVNVLTSRSRVPGIAYEARMFAPLAGVHEDPVCGSANCVMAPYWSRKLGLGPEGSISETGGNKEMAVLQVSKRGGQLWTEVDWEKGRVLVRGEAKLMARGEIYP